MSPPTVRDIWLAFVAAGLRSKFGLTVLALMLVAAGWQFSRGETRSGLIILGIAVLTYACVPAAIGASIAAYEDRRKRSRSDNGV